MMNLLLQLVEDIFVLPAGLVVFQIEKLAISIGLMKFLWMKALVSALKYVWMMVVVL
jgi:hypothetical protein